MPIGEKARCGLESYRVLFYIGGLKRFLWEMPREQRWEWSEERHHAIIWKRDALGRGSSSVRRWGEMLLSELKDLEHGEREARGVGGEVQEWAATRSGRALQAFVRTLASTTSERLPIAKFMLFILAVPFFVCVKVLEQRNNVTRCSFLKDHTTARSVWELRHYTIRVTGACSHR